MCQLTAATGPHCCFWTDRWQRWSVDRSPDQQVAQAANAALTRLYWHVGQRIRKEVLKNERAEYGEQILPTLSTQLVAEYGKAFGLRSLRRMVQFAEVFPDEAVVVAL